MEIGHIDDASSDQQCAEAHEHVTSALLTIVLHRMKMETRHELERQFERVLGAIVTRATKIFDAPPMAITIVPAEQPQRTELTDLDYEALLSLDDDEFGKA
ncbi:MAG: hypothetical protein ABWY78_06375 [Microvirga sp.]